jgi:ribosomal protein S16
MVATDNIKLKSLAPYLHLFPKPTGTDHIVKKGASVSDTVKFMPQAAKLSRWMVKDYVNAELRGLSIYGACRKLWHFVKEHIAYEKDDANYKNEKDIRENFEQVRSPRRLIADGKGDCDCMTNFVNACMLEFGVKKTIINRITAYDYNDFFQHIYSLIPDEKGNYIIMDCVWNEFNKEKKYTNKEDHIMELQFLDGIGSNDDFEGTQNNYSNLDAQDVYRNNEDFGELGKLFRKKSPEQKQVTKENRQKFIQKGRKVSNKINKVNPATALLRAGILASMKLNVMKVPEALKWGYASREYAQAKGMDMSKYDRIKKVLDKTQNIF